MSKTIIKVENLGKKYSIGDKQKFYTLRDSISSFFDFGKSKKETNDFWALKDVNFEVKQGESVGIIGRNGAGKSTLLKILSRITPPTTGKITLHGRVASLLEVGTGFHQELTGRENIFLNGAILGMSQVEIKRKFDEIVTFSEVEKFLDMPVKHYSSGMYMRLAFAVAAHLESEILIVDEVLAVGDAQFQKKCLGKMDEVTKKEGRTVLFVSHNLSAIGDLCKKTILVNNGMIYQYDTSKKVIRDYVNVIQEDNKNIADILKKRNNFFYNIEFNQGGKVSCGQPLSIKIYYHSKLDNRLKNSRIAVAFNDIFGNLLFICSTEMVISKNLDLNNSGSLMCYIDNLPLTIGSYRLDIFSEVNGVIQDWIRDVYILEVSDGKFFGGIRQTPVGSEGVGVLVSHRWEIIS